jgi:hypothetical protein
MTGYENVFVIFMSKRKRINSLPSDTGELTESNPNRKKEEWLLFPLLVPEQCADLFHHQMVPLARFQV